MQVYAGSIEVEKIKQKPQNRISHDLEKMLTLKPCKSGRLRLA